MLKQDDLAETTKQNRCVVRRLVEEALGAGHVRMLPDLVSPNYIGHLAIGDHYGPEGVRIDIAAYHAALPDLEVTLDDLFASGDQVARRYTIRGTHLGAYLGIQPSGRRVELRGLAIDRLAGEQLVESWINITGFGPCG